MILRLCARPLSCALFCAALASALACGRPDAAFTDVTGSSGLDIPGDGGAVVLFDADGDGRLDLFVARRLFLNEGNGRFREGAALSAEGTTERSEDRASWGAAAADYDNDGRTDLYVAGRGGGTLYHNDGAGAFSDVTKKAGLEGRRFTLRPFFADPDADGYLDLFLPSFTEALPAGKVSLAGLQPGRNLLFNNKGNGTFREVGVKLGLSARAVHGTAFPTDIDHDRDLDLLVSRVDGAPELWKNERQEGFVEDAAGSGLAGVRGTWGLVSEDLNNDRYRDLFFVSTGCAPNRLLLRRGYAPFSEVRSTASFLGNGGRSVAALDFDNDGDMDLLVGGSCTRKAGGFLLLRNRGDASFSDASGLLPLPEGDPEVPTDFSMGDYDGDGDGDLFLLRSGRVTLLRNDARAHWVDVALTGAQGSSKGGTGAKVEVKAGGLWVEREVHGLNGGSSQGGGPVHFGLGAGRKIDLVRVTWPTGIRQSGSDLRGDQTLRYTEKGQKASCPFLFAWDGKRFRFVTDMLGAGFIGILTGPDTYYQPDPDETIRLDSGLLQPKDGRYLLAIGEQLEEVDYFDQVRLVAVDHEPGVEVHPDERLMMGPPFPKPGIVAVRGARPPVRATAHRGEDILPEISARDRRSAERFQLLPFMGYTERHSIILDLGRARLSDPAMLLMHGMLRYWNSNSAYNASANGVRLEPPSVEVKDREGRWVRVVEDLGCPAGLAKTMTADLSGKFLSQDRSIRITTNMEIYWDDIRVSTQPAGPASYRVTELAPAQAELGWLGYPRQVGLGRGPDFEYDYQDPEPAAAWRTPAGEYTRYGDVTELLREGDDRFVIMAHGERILLAFDAARLPALRPGWERDFFVYVDGFVKEMNPHTAHLATVEPMPFHAMSTYPYGPGERYPADPVHAAYRKEYNRRRLPGKLGRLPDERGGGAGL